MTPTPFQLQQGYGAKYRCARVETLYLVPYTPLPEYYEVPGSFLFLIDINMTYGVVSQENNKYGGPQWSIPPLPPIIRRSITVHKLALGFHREGLAREWGGSLQRPRLCRRTSEYHNAVFFGTGSEWDTLKNKTTNRKRRSRYRIMTCFFYHNIMSAFISC